MNTYELAKSLTEKQLDNIIALWGDSEKANTYKTLVRLGDSKALAVATVLNEKETDVEFYRNAYEL